MNNISQGTMAQTQPPTVAVTMSNWSNASVEPLEDLNSRYARMLIPFSVLLGLFSAVGTLGNALVIAVFTTRQAYKQTTFKTFVVCLAIIDLISCITLIPAEIFKTRNYFVFPNIPCKIKCFFNMFNTTAAGVTLLIICIERFRKVCQPLRTQIGPILARKILLIMVAISVLVSIPAGVMCGTSEEKKLNIYNTITTVYMCTADEKYRTSIFRTIFKFGIMLLLFGVSVALIVMYIMIMRTVIRHWGEWAPTGGVRFERKQSVEGTDRIEIERLTDDAFQQDEVKALAENNGVSAGICSNGGTLESMKKKTSMSKGHEKKSWRKASATSTTSLSSASIKHKHSIHRQVSNTRRDSDSSFRAHSVRRRSSSTRDGRVPNKTLIWVVLTVIFIVTYFLYVILALFASRQFTMAPSALLIYSIFFRLYFINHIINPIVYVVMDRRFKSSCFEMMSGLFRKCGFPCKRR